MAISFRPASCWPLRSQPQATRKPTGRVKASTTNNYPPPTKKRHQRQQERHALLLQAGHDEATPTSHTNTRKATATPYQRYMFVARYPSQRDSALHTYTRANSKEKEPKRNCGGKPPRPRALQRRLSPPASTG